ncbi:hypothetical protein ACJJTC_001877 [Scirpophaga incertulas]
MARKGNRIFRLTDCEVEEYLMAETSDTEDALTLDDEDQSFLLEDMQAGFSEAIIEPPGSSGSTQNPGLSSDSLSTIPIYSSGNACKLVDNSIPPGLLTNESLIFDFDESGQLTHLS